MRYGWTQGVIVSVDEGGAVTIRGGSMDGLTTNSPALVGAKAGETWAMKVEPLPPFVFGGVSEARKVSRAARRAGR